MRWALPNPPLPVPLPITGKAAQRWCTAAGLRRLPGTPKLAAAIAQDGAVVSVAGARVVDSAGGLPTVARIDVRAVPGAEALTGGGVDALGRALRASGLLAVTATVPQVAVAGLRARGWSVLSLENGEATVHLTWPPQTGRLTIALLPQRTAFDWIDDRHSHLCAPPGSLFDLGVFEGGELRAVLSASVPKSRITMASGAVAEVQRVASVGGVREGEHAAGYASFVLGAAVRALLALGYTRIVSSTLLGESGTSYRAAGWWPVAISAGGEWTRAARARGKATQAGRKIRWETGPSAPRLAKDAEQSLLAEIQGARGMVQFASKPPCRGRTAR